MVLSHLRNNPTSDGVSASMRDIYTIRFHHFLHGSTALHHGIQNTRIIYSKDFSLQLRHSLAPYLRLHTIRILLPLCCCEDSLQRLLYTPTIIISGNASLQILVFSPLFPCVDFPMFFHLPDERELWAAISVFLVHNRITSIVSCSLTGAGDLKIKKRRVVHITPPLFCHTAFSRRACFLQKRWACLFQMGVHGDDVGGIYSPLTAVASSPFSFCVDAEPGRASRILGGR